MTKNYIDRLKGDCEREIERGGEYIALKPATVLALIAGRDALLALLDESAYFTRERCASAAESYGYGTDSERQARAALAGLEALDRPASQLPGVE